MSPILKVCRHLAICSLFGLATTSANATGISFDITGVSFTPGSGYGQDQDEKNGTLLDVQFDTAVFTAQNFTLDLPSPASYTFLFGTVDLEEPDADGGITADETDNLGVTASFLFTNPVGSTEMLTATGTADPGNVSGQGGNGRVDYTLTWTPVTVNFGTGRKFEIDLAGLTFSDQGAQDLYATVKLLQLPAAADPRGDPPSANIPEPASLGLSAIGLVAMGVASRRRKSAA